MDPYSELIKALEGSNIVNNIFVARIDKINPFTISIEELQTEEVYYNSDVKFNVGDTVLAIAPNDYSYFIAVCRLDGV